MYTTTNEGLLNNYAVEPPVYYSEFPSEWQQRQYAIQGGIAALLVVGLVLIALSIA